MGCRVQLTYGVPVKSPHPSRGEAGCNDPLGHISEVKVVAVLLVAPFVLADKLSNRDFDLLALTHHPEDSNAPD